MHRELIKQHGFYQAVRYVLVGAIRPILRIIPRLCVVDGYIIRPLPLKYNSFRFFGPFGFAVKAEVVVE